MQINSSIYLQLGKKCFKDYSENVKHECKIRKNDILNC